jgi:hypothetical protein
MQGQDDADGSLRDTAWRVEFDIGVRYPSLQRKFQIPATGDTDRGRNPPVRSSVMLGIAMCNPPLK